MPNNPAISEHDSEDIENDSYDKGDFGFIIGEDGDLKSVMLPEKLMDDPPIEVQMILKIFGISNIDDIESKSIH